MQEENVVLQELRRRGRCQLHLLKHSKYKILFLCLFSIVCSEPALHRYTQRLIV